jgi:hypothetical protein
VIKTPATALESDIDGFRNNDFSVWCKNTGPSCGIKYWRFQITPRAVVCIFLHPASIPPKRPNKEKDDQDDQDHKDDED